jgi:hydroxymethylglutaryl-CoA lyase
MEGYKEFVMLDYPKSVVIEEQGLRDGLQNQDIFVPTGKKLQIIHALIDAGMKRIQVTSFVNPEMIPQMADADDLYAKLPQKNEVVYSALVLNPKGMERAARAGATHVTASISVSNTHSQRNTGMSLETARKQFSEMVAIGKSHALTIRGGLQCVFGCRYEGRIDPKMADPRSIQKLCEPIITAAGEKPIYLHLHDTEGKGLANALAALQVGITHFDSAFGGMGGCPFIKNASGNISTEDLAFMLQQMGIETGLDVDKIAAISRSLEDFFKKPFPGKMYKIIARDDIKVIRGSL